MDYTDAKIVKPARKYFSEDLDITNWDKIEPELKALENQEIKSAAELIEFLEKVGEFSDILAEEEAWRYIRMTQYADQEKYSNAFNEFNANIVAKVKPFSFIYNKKFYDNPYRKNLDEKKYGHLNQIISNDIELYREENIALKVKEQELGSKYGAVYSQLSVTYKGEEKTLSQLAPYLKDPDREVRKEVWTLRINAMMEKRDEFNQLFDEMKELRIQQAKNAGFDNYRDYMHQAKGRFSYTPEALYAFHDGVEKEIVPFLKTLTEERKTKLGVDNVKPWDTSVDLDGKILKPFETTDEFIDNAMDILNEIKPKFGQQLNMMKNTGFLDLENRKGKAPGGYNYPLQETGAPFIFMNAVGLHRDVVTLLHESGHAMHSFAMKDIKLDAYKDTPSEIAELASMGMEFLSMDLWDKYYSDAADLKKAKKDQFEGALSFLPWCMIVDAFQHWIYLNPKHTAEEREDHFISLLKRYDTGIDWSGNEELRKIGWMFQLHIFEVPFYYIEYGMSQLGALSVYKNYKTNGKEKTLGQYEEFLGLGYTKPVNELYEAAGVKFDFSAAYLKDLVSFVKAEIAAL